VAVTSDGSVVTWGLNDWGQLGRQVTGLVDAATRVHKRSLLEQQHHKQQASESSSSSSSPAVAATAAPNSSSSINSCSHGWSCHSGTPGLVILPDGVQAVAAAAGRYSTLVLDDSGQLWVWGYDGCAKGELPEQSEAWRPRKVLGQLATKKVVAFDVGEWG
jgi:alpha-tubulin suppressor-like RCC1 family protein